MNLVIGVVGDESLHKHWISEKYDLFLIYYGDNESNKQKYKNQANHYHELKGTKFNIVEKCTLSTKISWINMNTFLCLTMIYSCRQMTFANYFKQQKNMISICLSQP